MRRVYKYMVMALLAVATISCVENDVPYPVVKLDILSLEADGMKGPVAIDAQSMGCRC